MGATGVPATRAYIEGSTSVEQNLFAWLCVVIALILIGAVTGKPIGWVVILLGILALLATLSPRLLR
jgi:ribose/xylose/arabinose/galactoside ABC-type transport system permease subunit